MLLDLASPVAANAIFSVATIALDLGYIIPIFCRRVYHSHPDVMFKPGPFYMGDGWMGLLFNSISISWTLFVCVVLSIPTNLPVTKLNMNYASVNSCLLATRKCPLFFCPFSGNSRWSYCLRLVSLTLTLPFTSMLTTIGVVYGTSRLLTSTTTGQSQTLKTNQSLQSIKIFQPKDKRFCGMNPTENYLL